MTKAAIDFALASADEMLKDAKRARTERRRIHFAGQARAYFHCAWYLAGMPEGWNFDEYAGKQRKAN